MSDVLDRARKDLSEGRPWVARARLTGAIANRRDDALVDLLAQVHHEMRDLPAAGRLWFVTGRSDHTALESIAAWQEQSPAPQTRWASIPAPLRDPARSPAMAQLWRDARDGGDGATRHVGPDGRLTRADEPVEDGWLDYLGMAGCGLVVLALAALLLIAGWTVVQWLR
ncbi:DUF6584 family protein [Actinomycetota bacterium]